MTSGKVTTVAFENWASKVNICMVSGNVATFESLKIAFNFKTEKVKGKHWLKWTKRAHDGRHVTRCLAYRLPARSHPEQISREGGKQQH